jgi:hypothetical protein
VIADPGADQAPGHTVGRVVCDLEETLWKGTLTEGGIEITAANFALIRTLAERVIALLL